MNKSSIEHIVAAAPPNERKRLRRTLESRDLNDAWAAIDHETFVRDRYASHSLMVASAARQEGRTTLSLALAVFTAVHDPARRVLLIDADLDHGSLGQLLGADGAKTLADFYTGDAVFGDCLQETAIANLAVITAQRERGDTVFVPRRFQELIESAREQFDLVVVDGPCAGNDRTLLSMANVVRDVVVVIKYGGPTREQVGALVADLERVEARVLGCVLNRREMVVPRFLYGAS